MRSSKSLEMLDANRAWLHMMATVIETGLPANPRNADTLECVGTQLRIDMAQPTIGVIARKVDYAHMANEALWILTGDNRLETIIKHAPSYSRYSDDGIILQGAYGPPVTEQMRYVVNTLMGDPFSRQAVISIWRPNPRQSRDIPCTVSMQFLIRGGKIHAIVSMRSNDLWLGFPYDVFAFTMIATMVSIRIGCPQLGELVLNVGSHHLYGSNIIRATDCIQNASIREFQPMSLLNLNHPDDLLNDLRIISDASLDPIKSPHLNSIYASIQENKRH